MRHRNTRRQDAIDRLRATVDHVIGTLAGSSEIATKLKEDVEAIITDDRVGEVTLLRISSALRIMYEIPPS